MYVLIKKRNLEQLGGNATHGVKDGFQEENKGQPSKFKIGLPKSAKGVRRFVPASIQIMLRLKTKRHLAGTVYGSLNPPFALQSVFVPRPTSSIPPSQVGFYW